MTRTPVVSTNVRSWGYDAEARELEVELVSGEVFVYEDVPPSTPQMLSAAKNVRDAFLKLVKGKHSYRKVEPQ